MRKTEAWESVFLSHSRFMWRNNIIRPLFFFFCMLAHLFHIILTPWFSWNVEAKLENIQLELK